MVTPRIKIDKIDVWTNYDKIISINKLIPNPRNPNSHPEKQIKILADVIEAQGWRDRITVSKLSGFITKGHGRLQAAQLKGWEEVPVEYQDYPNQAAEWADIIADNKIQTYSELDEKAVKEIILECIDSGEVELICTGYEEEVIEQMMTACVPECIEHGNFDNKSGASPWERMSKTASSGILFNFGEITCRIDENVYQSFLEGMPADNIKAYIEGVLSFENSNT